MKYKNYKNSHTNDNRIYSNKEIADMSVREVFKNKDAIMVQHSQIGIPSEKELQASDNVVYVQAYTREDGTEVKAHYRSKPEGESNNTLNSLSGTPTGSASEVLFAVKEEGIYIKSPEKISKFQNQLIKFNNKQNANYKDARDLMNISIIGPENIENTQNLKVLGDECAKQKLSASGIETTGDIKTIEFNNESSIAKSVNDSFEIKTQIQENLSKLEQKQHVQIEFKSDTNLFRSLHNATIVDFKNNNGNITGYLYDKYDFKYQSYNIDKGFDKTLSSLTEMYNYSNPIYGYMKTKDIEPDKAKNIIKKMGIDFVNDSATLLQQINQIKNYHILIPIKIKL